MAEGDKFQCGLIQVECCWSGQAQVSWTGSRAVTEDLGRVKVLLELSTRQSAEPRCLLFWELGAPSAAGLGRAHSQSRVFKSILSKHLCASEILTLCKASGEMALTWLSGVVCVQSFKATLHPILCKVQLFSD